MKTIRTHFLDFSDQLSPACGLLLSVLENKIFKERTLGVFICLIHWLAFLFSVLENKPTAYVLGRHSVFGIPSPKLTFWHMVFSWFYFFFKLFPPQPHSDLLLCVLLQGGKFYFMLRHELSFNWMCPFGGALAHNYPVILPVPILKQFLSCLFYLVYFAWLYLCVPPACLSVKQELKMVVSYSVMPRTKPWSSAIAIIALDSCPTSPARIIII